MKTSHLLPFLLVASVLNACAADLRPNQETAPDERLAQGSRVAIDASSHTEWVYFSCAAASIVQITDDPHESKSWDLAFQRFQVKSNGGDSGTGDVSVAAVTAAFDDVHRAPKEGYLTDVATDGPDSDPFPDLAFLVAGGGWFTYIEKNHLVVPRPDLVFIVKAVGGRYYKVQLETYYDSAGSGGKINMHWAAIAAPK
jgi:hypothetical protein